MAIKKKVTYSVSYTAGTDTLTTKLNSLLQDIVTLILSQNTGLSILDTITVGSERFTGAPLYDTYVSGLYSGDYQNRHYQSDVIFIGTNEDNICLSFGFFDGNLVVAMNMTPKTEKAHTDLWTSKWNLNANTYLPFYACGKASRWFKDVSAMNGNYAIPYTVANNAIAMSVIYWNEEYSKGYSFVNGSGQSDGVHLIIFPTDEGNNTTSIGAVIRPKGTLNGYRNSLATIINAFSFSENLSENMTDYMDTVTYNNPPPIPSQPVMQHCNSRYDWRMWFSVYNQGDLNRKKKSFSMLHSLGGANGKMDTYYCVPIDQLQINTTWDCPDPTNFLSALLNAYNLPHLNPGQAYVRKMRIPGWNPNCKGEIYLLWSPVVSAYSSGDIVEVGGKSYAIITEGAVAWAARVS